jgi:hypothetical protein
MLSITSSENVTDYKVLGQGNPTANTPTVIYTVPDQKSAALSSIAVCNQSSSAIRYSLAYKPSTANLEIYHYINYDMTIPAYETIVIKGGSLTSDYTVMANIQSPNVSVAVFGSEYYTMRTLHLNVSSNLDILDSTLRTLHMSVSSNAVVLDSSNISYIEFSLSGNIWSSAAVVSAFPENFGSNLRGIMWEGTKYIVAQTGTSKYIATSNTTANITLPESYEWTLRHTSSFDIVNFVDTGTKIIAYGTSSTFAESSDRGNTWTNNSSLASAGLSILGPMIWTGNLLVAGGEDGEVYRSNNLGTTWTGTTSLSSTSFGTEDVAFLTYGNNKIIAISPTGKVGISTDANTWIYDGGLYNNNYNLNITTGSAGVKRLNFINENFVFHDRFGNVSYSSDGNIWNYHTSLSRVFSGDFVNKIIDTGAYSVAVGDTGRVAYSTDPNLITWYYTNGLINSGWPIGRQIWDIVNTGNNLLLVGGEFYYASSQGSSVSNIVPTVSWINPSIGSTILLSNGNPIANIILNANVSGFGISNSIERYSANVLPSGLILSGNVISGTPNIIGSISTRLTSTFGINANTISTSKYNDITFDVS